jgi:hypothetical protein
MYIRTPAVWGLGDLPSAKPAATPYRPPITKGGQYIGEEDAGKLLTILGGPSPYQEYIRRVMTSKAASALPNRFLRIVSSPKEVPGERLRKRFVSVDNKIVGGTIDRGTGTIYMIPAPGRRSDTRLEFALHEAVHLFAHPFMALVDDKTFQSSYGRGCTTETDVGTFQRKYCFGFGEGATQIITEQIMEAQGISKSDEKPYREFTPAVLELIKVFSLDRFGRAYFWGAVHEFTQAMEFRWGNGWRNVANFTSARNTKRALEEINKLELAYIKRRGPKGDFPSPSSYARYEYGLAQWPGKEGWPGRFFRLGVGVRQ